MNKQELINELNLARDSYSNEDSFRSGVRTGLRIALGVIEKLDEPEKVEPLVVPKELGEWLAKQDIGDEGRFFSIIGRLDDMLGMDMFDNFIDDNKKELIEVILGTRPYKVEKEELYYVLDKKGKTMLMSWGGKATSSGGYSIHDVSKGLYQLTERQIKDYDERYWPFAVEVAE